MKKTAPVHTKITPRQMQILKQIESFRCKNGYSPTIAELAQHLKTSRATAFGHVAELKKKHLLSASPRSARSLILTEKATELLESIENPKIQHMSDSKHQIPLLGNVAAGLPIEALEDNRTLSLHTQFPTAPDTFALQVKGDSMIDDGIFDGDYVICRHAKTAPNGTLVIALVDENNATLKRFYKEKNAVRLQPANQNYQPILSKNCKIQAIVTGLIRKF